MTVSASARGVAAHHLALVGVQPAAEGEDLDAHGGYAARSIAPVKAVATGPVISTWPSSRHSISSSPPSTTHRGAPAGQAAAVRVHQRGAGAGAAGAGQPGAALPDPQPDAVRRQDLRRSRYWRARGTAGRAPARGPSSSTGRRVDVGDEERRVRVAHAGRRRIGDRPGREVEVQRVHRAGQRDVAPVEPRRPHVDRAPARRPAPRRAGCRRRCGSPGRGRPVSRASRSATQRVALPQAPASPPSGLRMRMKASASEPAGAGSIAMNWSQPTPVRRSAIAAARRGREAKRAGAFVEHDEVVAAAVHLEEARHGEGICATGAKVEGARAGGCHEAERFTVHSRGRTHFRTSDQKPGIKPR